MNATEPVNFHCEWLLRVLVSLFGLAGIAPGGAAMTRLSKPVRLAIARVLLPAESAGRRLIYFMAERLVGPILPPKTRAVLTPKSLTRDARSERVTRKRAPVFWLFDRRKFFWELSDPGNRFVTGLGPNIRFFDGSDPVPDPESDVPVSDPDDARRLCQRMLALQGALEDLPAQARRLLRMMERRKKAPPGPGRYGPLRPGLPPGYRRTWTHEVDGILYDCEKLARSEGPLPDP